MWVAISKPRGAGTRLMSVVAFEGAIVELPDDREMFIGDEGTTLYMRGPNGWPIPWADGAGLLDAALRGDRARIVVFYA